MAKKIRCDCGILFTPEEGQAHCVYCGKKLTDIRKGDKEDLSSKVENTKKRRFSSGGAILGIIIAIIVGTLVKTAVSSLNNGVSENNTKENVTNYFLEETWSSFNSTEGKFKINFPKYPTTDSPETGTALGFTYISTTYSVDSDDGESYIVIYGYYPEIFPEDFDVKVGLEGSVNAMLVSNKSNKLISSDFISVGRHQGLDYVINNEDESLYMKGRIVVVSEGKNSVKMYILMVASETNKFNNNNFNKFINSFEILQ